MRLTFLGTGAAGGVPLWGCDCPVCVRARVDASVRRQPNCALLEAGEVRLLLDAGVMDVAERFPPGALNAVLVTHFHADHVQGLFHLRWGKGELDVYSPHDREGCADLYKLPGPLKFKQLSKFETFELGDVRITAVPLVHSKPTLGYCFEHDGARLAYLSDCSDLPPATFDFLKRWQPHTLCLDCTYPPGTDGPRNHFDLPEAIALSQQFPHSEMVLMHIGHKLDEWLATRSTTLPLHVNLARDGKTVDCTPVS
ncbi:MAG: phosphonate metabolism protein PhnP [Gallionellales bacterium GWA2_59_43]|nr:MAG: phosphonate metabolism protein PhnP [Gallionellales bacterium GWA2_59_43]